jgi:DNA-binding Lrp family transcriptional regulator
VDRLDVAILAHLFRDPRVGYAELGKSVGLSANAAKARVGRMQRTGVLRGFAASPDPALLGMADGLLVFSHVDDLDERESDILASLPDVPGVRFVDVTLDGSVHVWLQHKDDADWERIERAAVSLVGKPPALAVKDAPRASAAEPAPTDWRLMRALLPDARATMKTVAQRSGLSFKTARRRLAALVSSGLLRIEPVLSPSDASGLVLFDLSVVLAPGATPGDLLRLLPDTAFAQTFPGSRLVVLHAARETLREAQRDFRAVKASPLVERVIFSISTRRRADAWLDEVLAAHTQPRRAAPRAPLPVPRAK